MTYTYELCLNNSCITKDDWLKLIQAINVILGRCGCFHIKAYRVCETVHYYIEANMPLPVSLGVGAFLLKPADTSLVLPNKRPSQLRISKNLSFLTVIQRLLAHGEDLYAIDIQIRIALNIYHSSISLYIKTKRGVRRQSLIGIQPENFLSVDFNNYPSFVYKKIPKYFKIDKLAQRLSNDAEDAIFQVDTFPYFNETKGLRYHAFDFTKHSLVIGGSGTGKSKFLMSLIHKIYKEDCEKYRVVVIDPHDTLYKDCAEIISRNVTNFCSTESSIDLFSNDSHEITASVEFIIELFRSMLSDSYNGRLERMLRYSAYLLIMAGEFNFVTLRRLFIDTNFRNKLLTCSKNCLPTNVTHFFLTDFNELKTQYYNEAISPILALIDEMLMVPTLNNDKCSSIKISSAVAARFLNIFSLNPLRLGTRATQIIAGLLMRQFFELAESKIDQHLIIIIDEVAVVEQPILSRFLSELRKYNVTVILASQYFGQISENLRMSIFANVVNYYLFRTSRDDAMALTQRLKILPANSNDPEDTEKVMTKLANRECIVRVMDWNEEIIPAFKARVSDFNPPPLCEELQPENPSIQAATDKAELGFSFNIEGCDIATVMNGYSTSRKKKDSNNEP